MAEAERNGTRTGIPTVLVSYESDRTGLGTVSAGLETLEVEFDAGTHALRFGVLGPVSQLSIRGPGKQICIREVITGTAIPRNG